MPRLGIRLEDVESSAEEILAAGENPTIERIRIILGTGSNSTISKHLHTWQAKRLKASAQNLSAPSTPPDPVHAAVNQVWEQIHEESKTQINAIREEAKIQIEAAQIERQEALEALSLITKEHQELEKQLNQIAAAKEILSLDYKTLQQEDSLLKEKHQSLKMHSKTLQEQLTNQLYELQTLYKEQEKARREEISRLTAAHNHAISQYKDMHENERQRQMVALDATNVENIKREKIINDQKEKIHQLKIEILELKSQFSMLSKERDTMSKESLLKDEKLAAQEVKYTDLHNQLSKFAEDNNATHNWQQEISKNIAMQSSTIENINEALVVIREKLLQEEYLTQTD